MAAPGAVRRNAHTPGSPGVVLAAVAPVPVVIAADVVAGSHPAHVGLLGLAAVLLGSLRLRLRLRLPAARRRLVASLTILVLVTPLMHAAAVLGTRTRSGTIDHPLVDGAVSAGHVVLALLVAAGVAAADTLLALVRAGIEAWRHQVCTLPVLGVESWVAPAQPDMPAPPVRPRPWSRFDRRRGPPPLLVF